MALLDFTDYQAQTNTTLSTPDGRALANTLANAILSWSARYCNRLSWEYGTQTEYFSPDYYADTFFLSALPVDTAQPVAVATYNPFTATYDAYTLTVRANSKGRVKTYSDLIYGDEAVRIDYTGGYTDNTFPADLRHALASLLVRKFTSAQEGDRVLTQVTVGRYIEQYDVKDADMPMDTLEVLDSYRLPVVF